MRSDTLLQIPFDSMRSVTHNGGSMKSILKFENNQPQELVLALLSQTWHDFSYAGCCGSGVGGL
jgi:hypothetical protein